MSDADPELILVWYLYHVKGWPPSRYWDMGEGEKALVWAMASLESDLKGG